MLKPLVIRAVVTAFPLIMGLVAARELGPVGRGLIALGVGLSIAGTAVAGMGRTHAVRTFLLHGGDLRTIGLFITQSIRRIALLGTLVGALAVGVAYAVISNQQLTSRGFLLGLFALIPFAAFHQFLAATLVGLRRHRQFFWAEMIPLVAALLLFLLSVAVGIASAATYMMATAISYGVSSLVMWNRMLRPLFGDHANTDVASLHGTRSSWLFDILDITSTRNDRLIAALIMSASDAGIYAIAGTFVIVWRFIPQSIALTHPLQSGPKGRSRLLSNVGLKSPGLRSVALVGASLGITVAFAPLYLPILVGEEFISAVGPLAILAFAELLMAIYILASYRLIHVSATRQITLAPLLGSVLLPLFMLLGYQWAGVTGSALAVALTYALMVLFQIGVLLRARS